MDGTLRNQYHHRTIFWAAVVFFLNYVQKNRRGEIVCNSIESFPIVPFRGEITTFFIILFRLSGSEGLVLSVQLAVEELPLPGGGVILGGVAVAAQHPLGGQQALDAHRAPVDIK